MTHDGLGKYLSQRITEGARARRSTSPRCSRTRSTDVVVSYLPVGSEQATKWYVEQILEAGCGFVNCIPVFIAREDYWNNRFIKAGPADRRRRHQVPGRRHDRAPRAGAAVPRARRQAAAHVAAQRRRQHGLLQHARARAAGVQEDLQDQRGHVGDGPRAARRRRPRRPVGLRAVADRPQVGAHPRSRARRSATCRCSSSSSSRSGTRRTRPASSPTPCAAASSR